MTVHKLTAGDGYTYLTRQVAGGDVPMERGQSAAEYYTAKGNPPGRWMGRGAELLGLDGAVSEEQMKALYGDGMQPEAARLIEEYLAEHVEAGMTGRQLKAVQAAALRSATLGTRFPDYQALPAFTKRVQARLKDIERQTGRRPTTIDRKQVQAEESRRARAAVAGFDVVFAPVKSAALLWALDPRAQVRHAVRAAHEAARDAAFAMLQEHAAFTRTGKGGVSQIATHGLIAAVFDHYDSRGGDPNLHTHVAISSKVQGVDGKWRSLDARALYRITVAASEFYNTRFETELQQRLPVGFTERADTRDEREPIREIAGVPLAWIEFFSSRRTEIEARYEQLLRQFRREHGHDPNRAICHQLARQANLDTREAKKTARSLEEMRTDWTDAFLDRFGARALTDLADVVDDAKLATLTIPTQAAEAEPGKGRDEAELRGLAEQVVRNVAAMRSTWTVWNLRAEAERLARQKLIAGSAARHDEVVAAIVKHALGPDLAVRVDQPSPVREPAMLRRADGTSVFVQHASARFTSRIILDAEDRLLAAARTPTTVGLAGPQVAAALDGVDARLAEKGMKLDAGQRRLVTTFAADDRLLVVGLGPAGAGKTTAMRAYAHVAAQAGQRIVPLATSAAAAQILGDELGVRADNLHKFLTEYTTGRYARELNAGQRVPVFARMFALNPGNVVLVDEAGMAGTLLLDRLVQIAARRGAVVRLLGDHRQLGAVESGGALRLISHEAGAAELTTLYRFTNPAEADATLKIRVGDSSGLDFYLTERRVQTGSKQAMIESAYAAWKTDMLAGKTTLMAAATGHNVTELSAQARRDRVEAGQVHADGVALHDGNHAGAGDWIVTRHNERRLSTAGGRDWVKNGDGWTVQRRHTDGSLTVRHLNHHSTVTLPAAYVAANVELLYATTTNRAQGSTVDTAHPLITPEMSRENFYVVTTRARERTTLYVTTHQLLAFDPDDRLDRARFDARQYAAREVLENILAREGNEISATETLRQAADEAGSLATLVPRHHHGSSLIAAEHYMRLVHETLPRPLAGALSGCEGWPQAVAALATAEADGWPAEHLLNTVARDGGLLTADTPGRLLAWRINHYTTDRTPPAPLARPSLADTTRYAALLSAVPGAEGLDPAAATHAPALLRPSDGPEAAHVTSDDLASYAHAAARALHLPLSAVTTHRAWPHLAAVLAAADRSGRDLPGLLGPLAAELALTHPATAPEVRVTELSRQTRRLLNADPATGPAVIPHQLKHTATATAALGHHTAERLRAEPAWAALDAALRRTERDGHDPVATLKLVARARDCTTAVSPAQALASRLNRYTSTLPPQPAPASATDWRTLAWTLKALEGNGVDLAALLNDAAPQTMDDVLRTAHDAGVQQRTARHDADRALPWLAADDDQRTTHPDLKPYLDDLDTAIRDRVHSLTASTIDAQPRWSTALGTAPEDPAGHAEWERHVGIVAAYRDQAKVLTDDARQILGPYAEPGRHDHSAYWHAVDSILIARHLSGLTPETPQTSDERARAQVAANLYLALPADERATIHNTVAQRRGALWFGARTGLDDTSVTHPANTLDLQHVLTERGHLDTPEKKHIRQAVQPTAKQPVEVQTVEPRTATVESRRAAGRTTRMETARLNNLRTNNRQARQPSQHVPTQRTHTQQPQTTPTVQPQPQPQQPQQRRLGL
ncbi:MobF family relaxase [Actinomadura flavalba]|uniref:MobF family relaxase n=1 Tax=Actinomadura flavalba TaxID=1120938 RepID=UPI0012DC6F41|nr:MobF family relaxase [Actinomadura flavalba]